MGNKNLMLCQGCLRVIPFDIKGHQGECRCKCGGEWCGCDHCNETAKKLSDGVRDAKELELKITGVIKWSADEGVGK